MLKQYVERRNELSHCLLSAEAIESVDDDDNEEFPLDVCTFPTAKKPESYRDVSISDTLTSEQRKEVETLIKQFPHVLLSFPGRTDRIQHDIKLLTSEPIYSIPYKTRSVSETEIQGMLDLGVIEPSISPYSSPIVFVPKKDGSMRFCIDFRKLYEVTEFDAESIRIWKRLLIECLAISILRKWT